MSSENSADRFYLGLDLSTQQLKAIVINENLETIDEDSVNFNDRSVLVHHVQPHGFEVDPSDERCVTTPVFVFLESIDVLLKKLKEKGKFDFSKIVAISGCGQQHGSVYWKRENDLNKLKNCSSSNFSLCEILKDSFSKISCPIWMDSSTTVECRQIEKNVGGAEKLFQITGSKCFERFTASQIRKFFTKNSSSYEETERIELISNFVASIFIGDFAPIDFSDGSGMNLLDVRRNFWSKICLESCAENLEEKLGATLCFAKSQIGTISNYFVDRYAFQSDCRIVSFTGDNPSSYYALASSPKTLLISLGTSDTVMASIPIEAMPETSFDGHLLVNPLASTDHENILMLLLCFKNGSLVRERVREQLQFQNWEEFNKIIRRTEVGNQSFLGFFFDDPEILPTNIQGRFYFDGQGQRLEQLEPNVQARALFEGQSLAKRLYLERANVNLEKHVDKIVVTGGASVNVELLQILADVFGKTVYTASAANSGALGGALRAIDVINKKGKDFSSTVECFIAAQPREENTSIYEKLYVHYRRCEEELVKKEN